MDSKAFPTALASRDYGKIANRLNGKPGPLALSYSAHFAVLTTGSTSDFHVGAMSGAGAPTTLLSRHGFEDCGGIAEQPATHDGVDLPRVTDVDGGIGV